jgi:hypothetical protein
MDFEISGYTSSGLQIKYLKVQEMGKKISLNKWIRLITLSDSNSNKIYEYIIYHKLTRGSPEPALLTWLFMHCLCSSKSEVLEKNSKQIECAL